MYSRSYYPTEGVKPEPPENYDGTTFRETDTAAEELPYEAPDFIPEAKREPKTEPVSAVPENVPVIGKASLFPFISKLGNLSIGGIFGENGLFSNIGVEEILILAIAAYLIFSGSGDTECAVMLLLLLFIS